MSFGSLLQLGFRFFKRLFLRIFGLSKGLDAFKKNYGKEHLLPVSTDERRALEVMSSCIGCKMCDLIFPYDAVDSNHFRKPSDFFLAYTRSIHEYGALQNYLTQIKKGDLKKMTQVCPSQIPFEKMVTFFEEKAKASNA